MKEKSLAKNAIWNFLYTGMNLFFPLIISPYVSRVLGAENIGKVEFAKSFLIWFTTFGSFGVTIYGIREIAKIRNNKALLSKVFKELFYINFLFSVVALFIYIVLIFTIPSLYADIRLMIVMSLTIIFNIFNIDWFYQGIEEYSYITKRNAVIKIVTLIATYVFITNKDDYIMYGFITVIGNGLVGFFNLNYAKNFVNFKESELNFYKHIPTLGTFFLSTFVVNIYTNSDATLMGFMSKDSDTGVAYLQRAKSIKGIATTISLSIANVAMPRASYYISTNKELYLNLVKNVFNLILLLSLPTMIGISILSDEIMLLLGGETFLPAGNLLVLVSFSIVFAAASTFLQQQILIPNNQEKFGLIASIYSGITSVLLNLVLIPFFGYMGSGFAILIAEIVAVISRFNYSRKSGLGFRELIDYSLVKYITASVTMSVVIYGIKFMSYNYIITIILSIGFGSLIYFITLSILKERYSFLIYNKLVNGAQDFINKRK